MTGIRTMRIACTVEYAVMPPQGRSGGGPLLLVLHGWGQTCGEFIAPFSVLAEQGIAIAAPQAPHPFYVRPEEKRIGFSWLTRHRRDETVADLVAYLDALRDRLASEAPHDPERVYVLGFSQGSSVAYRYATLTERPVAGVVSCGSDLPPDVAARLHAAAPARILLVNGTRDRIVPPRVMESARAGLEAAGVPVTVHTFPGGHRIPPGAVEAIGAWLIEGGKG